MRSNQEKMDLGSPANYKMHKFKMTMQQRTALGGAMVKRVTLAIGIKHKMELKLLL